MCQISKENNEQLGLPNEKLAKTAWIKVRYIQTALLLFLVCISFQLRICLSVAIVAMTSNNTSSNPDVPYYHWENSNIILSSFYWSYAVLHLFAGHLAHYFGPKKLLLISNFLGSLCSILIPGTAEYFGASGVMSLRVIQGLCQASLLPGLSNILGRWAPPEELSSLNSIVFSGVQVGVLSSMIITGYLSASWWGWPAAFYLFGIIGFIWCIFWTIFSAETPADHPTISAEERKHIENSLGHQDDHLIDKVPIPWMAILKSLPYWAIIVASVGESWTTTFLYAELPSYLSYAIGLDIKDSSLFSAAPTVGALFGCLIFGQIAGYIIKKGWVTTVNSRRIFQGFSMSFLTGGLILVSYTEDKFTIAVLLIISSTAGASVACGHLVNSIDLSPRYTGILTGVSNGIGQLVAIFAPVLVHFVVTDKTDKTLWRHTFIMAAVIGTSTAVFFIIFCSADRQWWDEGHKKKTQNSSENTFTAHGETNGGFENDLELNRRSIM